MRGGILVLCLLVAVWGATASKDKIRIIGESLREVKEEAVTPPPTNLLTEYLENPIGIDNLSPRFTWTLTHPLRAQWQTSFRIQVSNSSSFAITIWDVVANSANTHVVYGSVSRATPLALDSTYYWRVLWWDATNTASAWSETASFDTGIDGNTWGDSIGGEGNLLRYEFNSADVPSRARAYVAGLGYYELYINGERVGDARLDAGWSQYNRTILYNAYNVTSLIKEGNNAIGVMLGHGWYSSVESREPDFPLTLIFTLTGDDHKILASSNSDWQVSAGPIIYDGVYNGETYNSNLEQPGWNTVNFNPDYRWNPVYDDVPLTTQSINYQAINPIRILAEIKPLSVTKIANNTYVFDFGQNFSGWCLLNVTGPAGTAVTLRHAEILEANGSGNIYTANLRSAKATDVYVLSGNRDGESYEPHFTYHGFRYVEFTTTPAGAIVPTLETLTGHHVASDVGVSGAIEFTASGDILNQIQHNIFWGQQSNLMSVPTDCDQRDERKGWMGDAQLSSEEALHNFFMPAFYTHFLTLIQDTQSEEGAVPDTVPWTFGSRPGDPSWQAAYPSILYWLSQHYNDLDVVRKHYNSIKSLTDWLVNSALSSGIGNMFAEYGDWVPPPPAPSSNTHLTASFSVLGTLQQFVSLAQAIGNTADVSKYSEFFTTFAEDFNHAFFNSSINAYGIGLQTENALPLWLGIIPANQTEIVVKYLLNDIVNTYKTHLSTGIIGTKYLIEALHNIGRDDIALQLAETLDYPSWGYMVVNTIEPATTLWELWNSPTGSPGMDSRNHIMFGSVGAYFYKVLAGVDHSTYNYGTISIAPTVVGDLRGVSANFTVAQGEVSVVWKVTGGSRVCGRAAEQQSLVLDCGQIGSSGVITDIDFASFGTPSGECGNFARDTECHSETSLFQVKKSCIGRPSCEILATDAVFASGCESFKRLYVQARCSAPAAQAFTIAAGVPVGSNATIAIPTLDFANVVVTESGTTIWANGTYKGGVSGITSAVVTGNKVVVSVGSGAYNLALSGTPGDIVCSTTNGEFATVQCSQPDQIITQVQFASFGNPSGTCSNYEAGSAHAGCSKAAVEPLCLFKNSCTIPVNAQHFGLPEGAIEDDFAAQFVCAKL